MVRDGSDHGVINWGKGIFPISWAMMLIGTVLISNCAAIIISLPYIIDNVPKEYLSSLTGSFELPYMPLRQDELELRMPSSVPACDPFDVSVHFQGDLLPSVPYEVVLMNGTRYFTSGLLPAISNDNIHVLYTRYAGLKDTGTYHVYLRPRLPGHLYGENWPDVPDSNGSLIWFGPWYIDVVDNPSLHPSPVLYEDLALGSLLSSYYPSDQLTFASNGINEEMIEDFHVETDHGGTSDLVFLSERRWALEDPEIIHVGWNTFDIVRVWGNSTSSRWSYLCWRSGSIESGQLWDAVSISRALSGTDELYDQVDEGPKNIVSGEGIELYQGAYYEMVIDISDIDVEGDDLEVEMGEFLVHPPLSIMLGDSTYWLPLRSEGRYRTVFKAPTSMKGDPVLRIDLHGPFLQGPGFGSNITLAADRSPGFEMVPDPFMLGSYNEGIPPVLEIFLSADWADFNRKDFSTTPTVEVQGKNITPTIETDEFFEHVFRYRSGPEDYLSGGGISIRSENSLRFANWVSLILPMPGLFLTLPFPIIGWGAVVWFFLISAVCLLSVGLLFYRTLEPLWSKEARRSKEAGIVWLMHGKNDLTITAKAFLGAMFFFYAVYWMFDIFEQPTPGLSILSQETPIWIRMFLLADASVWEEVSGRLIIIGIPMLIYHSIMGRRGIQWKQLIGGTGNFGYGEVLFILLSATLFGLAHLGWGPWKVVPTFVHGLIYGYLFVKVGLHASIAMHFLFDYSDIFWETVGQDLPTMMMLIFVTSLVLGGLFLGEWVGRCHGWFSKMILRSRPRPVYLLVLHSILSLLFGVMLVAGGGIGIFSLVLMATPLLDAAAFLLWKRYGIGSARWIALISSYLSWGVSPFGLAWVVDPGPEQDH
ncbi:MAG: CPBP family intramembrane metalloprotease [Candidatus Thermoplasmatota archaeon]|nr:CPBP family intramembrane metalloprotease [Candidatus Thermoplasmatota archaeon]